MKSKIDGSKFIAMVLACLAVLIVVFCHCDKATGSFAPVAPTIPTGNFLDESYSFKSTPDSIVISQLLPSCFHDSLISYYASRSAYHYSLIEPNLVVTLKDSVSNACTTSLLIGFTRVSGTRLRGQWVFDSTWCKYRGIHASSDSIAAITLKKNFVAYGYKWAMFSSDTGGDLNVYHNPDTTVFTSTYFAQNKKKLDSLHIELDSILNNAVRLICVSYKGNNPIFDTLTITNYYKAGKTVFQTSDTTTKYTPDPYTYYRDSVCASRSLPPWYGAYIGKNNKTFPN